jgi:hypothetical protein
VCVCICIHIYKYLYVTECASNIVICECLLEDACVQHRKSTVLACLISIHIRTYVYRYTCVTMIQGIKTCKQHTVARKIVARRCLHVRARCACLNTDVNKFVRTHIHTRTKAAVESLIHFDLNLWFWKYPGFCMRLLLKVQAYVANIIVIYVCVCCWLDIYVYIHMLLISKHTHNKHTHMYLNVFQRTHKIHSRSKTLFGMFSNTKKHIKHTYEIIYSAHKYTQ